MDTVHGSADGTEQEVLSLHVCPVSLLPWFFPVLQRHEYLGVSSAPYMVFIHAPAIPPDDRPVGLFLSPVHPGNGYAPIKDGYPSPDTSFIADISACPPSQA